MLMNMCMPASCAGGCWAATARCSRWKRWPPWTLSLRKVYCARWAADLSSGPVHPEGMACRRRWWLRGPVTQAAHGMAANCTLPCHVPPIHPPLPAAASQQPRIGIHCTVCFARVCAGGAAWWRGVACTRQRRAGARLPAHHHGDAVWGGGRQRSLMHALTAGHASVHTCRAGCHCCCRCMHVLMWRG